MTDLDDERLEELRFPIGRYEPVRLSPDEIADGIERIATLPKRLRAAVEGMSDARLDTIYRPEGWTVRQVVHHLADSHINSWCRFRIALTEDDAEIRPYLEDRWARLPDAKSGPVDLSLDLLDTLHARWVALLRSLGPAELERTYHNPESDLTQHLDEALGMYAWHGDHHLAHITRLAERSGW